MLSVKYNFMFYKLKININRYKNSKRLQIFRLCYKLEIIVKVIRVACNRKSKFLILCQWTLGYRRRKGNLIRRYTACRVHQRLHRRKNDNLTAIRWYRNEGVPLRALDYDVMLNYVYLANHVSAITPCK